MASVTLSQAKDRARAQDWPGALAAADAMLADADHAPSVRRALHVIRLKALLLVPTTHAAREAASAAAETECPEDPVIALMCARVLRRTAVGSAVLRLARIAARSEPHFAAAVGIVIDVLLERGRYAAALRTAGDSDMRQRIAVGTVGKLAGAALVANDITKAAELVADAQARERYASGIPRYAMILANTIREREAAPAAHPRHIAILCADGADALRFGSLVAPRLGLTFVGDTAQLTNEDAPWVCAACGPACPCLDDDFRFAMQQDDRGWFARIAEHLGADAILSSEKSVLHYLNHDPLRRFDIIILFSSPATTVDATVGRLRRLPMAKGGLAAAVGKALDAWSHANATYLSMATSAGSAVAIDLERFQHDPDAHLPRLAAQLALQPRSGGVVDRVQHFAAASSVSAASLAAPAPPADRSTWPEEVREEVAGNRHAAFLHRLLERRYRRSFAAS